MHVDDFSHLADEPFIEAAYCAALQRSPDPWGKKVYLDLLAQGVSKAEILTYLVESPEGRSLGVHIHGLSRARRRARLQRYPGVGALLRLSATLWPFG